MWTVTLPDGKKKHSKKFAIAYKEAVKSGNVGKCKMKFKSESIKDLKLK